MPPPMFVNVQNHDVANMGHGEITTKKILANSY
jgi:hypothetical protein